MEDNDLPVLIVLTLNLNEDQIAEYMSNLEQAISTKAIVKSIDSNGDEGSSIRELYEIEEDSLPAVLLTQPDETLYKGWYGQDLPGANEVAYELTQITGSDE